VNDIITIIIPGEPTPKGRPRIGRNRHTGKSLAYTPTKTRTAETVGKYIAKAAMRGRLRMDGPVVVEMIAYRSKGMPRTKVGKAAALAGDLVPETKPDLDNIIKLALDICNEIVFNDDNQVVDISAKKRFSDNPRLEIRVWPYKK